MSKVYAYWIVFIASLGGFLQSYVASVIAGALLFISKEFRLTPFKEGNVASFILLGALAGSVFSGYLADRFGRRSILILSSAVYLFTALFVYLAHSFTSLMVLRLATGFAVGITSILVPLYLTEISPSAHRGAFVSCYQLFITIGTLAAYFVNLLLTKREDWRMMFFAASIPAGFQLVFLFFFPESPRWLLGRGKAAKASLVADQMGGDLPIADSMSSQPLFSARFLFLIVVGLVLSAFQQLTGINAVVYFTPRIFRDAGFNDPGDAIFATLLVGIVNVISTFLTILLIDRIGRRKLLLFSQIGVIITLLILVLSFATESSWIDFTAVGAVILYIFFYSLGFGPIVWVLISEIFPLAVRAKALALCTFVSWLSNYLVVLTFPSLKMAFGSVWVFTAYAFLTLIGFLFCARYIPETKGKTLEQLEKFFISK